MTNRMKVCSMILLAILGVTACGNLEESTVESKIEEKEERVEIKSFIQIPEIFETEDKKEEETQHTEMAVIEEEADLYMRFLAGNEPLYFHKYMHNDYFEAFYEVEKGYTLDEIIEILKSKY